MIYKWDYKYSEEGDFFYHDWVDMLGGDMMLGEPTPTALDCPGLTFGSVVTTGTITKIFISGGTPTPLARVKLSVNTAAGRLPLVSVIGLPVLPA